MTNWRPEPQSWRQHYLESGYLVVENAIEPELLQKLRDALERIEQQFAEAKLDPGLRRWVATDQDRAKGIRGVLTEGNSETISNIMELPLFDPVFQHLIIYPRVLDILEALFESTEFAFHNYKCICKMPGGKEAFPWHRDLPYLPHTSPNLLTCMLCIDPMTKENGATVVCPGSHRIPHEQVKAGDTDMNEAEVPAERVTVICPAGSAVVFHVSIIHGGPPNETQTRRRNVIGIWAAPDAHPTTPPRYVYHGIMPRSTDLMRQKQIAMAFGQPP